MKMIPIMQFFLLGVCISLNSQIIAQASSTSIPDHDIIYLGDFTNLDSLMQLKVAESALLLLIVNDRIYLPKPKCLCKRDSKDENLERSSADESMKRNSDSESKERTSDSADKGRQSDDEAMNRNSQKADLGRSSDDSQIDRKSNTSNISRASESESSDRSNATSVTDRKSKSNVSNRSDKSAMVERASKTSSANRVVKTITNDRDSNSIIPKIKCKPISKKACIFEIENLHPNAKIKVYDGFTLREASGHRISY